MKKIFKSFIPAALAVCLCTASATAFAGCASGDESYTAMQIDLNPSVEFILDSENKVVSVTALNDDGAVIISGEAFAGKSAEDAAALFVEVSTQTGYLVKGEGSVSNDKITVSVSGNAEEAQKLYDSVESKVTETVEKYGVSAAVAKGEELKTATLRATVKKCYPELTDGEIAAMTDEELVGKLAESRKETQELVSYAIREAYYKAKAYNLTVTESEAFGTVVCDVNSAYQTVMAGYLKGVETLKSAVDAIEETQYRYFIDPDSAYQKAVTSVLQAKKDVLVQKGKVAELDDGLEKTAAQVILAQKETLLTTAEASLDAYYKAAESAFTVSESAVQAAVSALENLQSSLPDEITAIVTEKASDIEQSVNTAKDNFFEQFEKQYAQAINDYNSKIASIKSGMKS